MKYIQKSMLFLWSLFLLLLPCFQIKAENNEQGSYVYLNDAVYNVGECMHALGEIDDDAGSPINVLKQYISNGEKVGLYCDIMPVLEYAQELLMQKGSDDNEPNHRYLVGVVDNLIKVIDEGSLSLSSKNHNLKKKSFFMIDDIQLDDLGLAEPYFRLSVLDQNITMVDSIDDLHGNIVKAGDLFINNFGTDNTFAGKFSGVNSRSTSNNTGFGNNALVQNNAGRNVAVGSNALNTRSLGNQNVAIGAAALQTSGASSAISNNAVVGDGGAFNSAGGFDSAGGFSFNAVAGSSAFADDARSNRNYNVVVGATAGHRFLPDQATPKPVDSEFNVFLGFGAGPFNNVPGKNINNISIGFNSGGLSTPASFNIYIAQDGSSGSNVIAIGRSENQKRCFIGGINPTSRTDIVPVVIGSSNQLGTLGSSERFKENIQPMNEESEFIYNLNPVSFVYKNDKTRAKHYGLIAEEVNEYSTDLVIKDNEDVPYTVRYEMLPVLLLNELKKHNYEIQQQEDALQKQEYTRQQQCNEIQMQEQEIRQLGINIDSLLCVANKLQEKAQRVMAG